MNYLIYPLDLNKYENVDATLVLRTEFSYKCYRRFTVKEINTYLKNYKAFVDLSFMAYDQDFPALKSYLTKLKHKENIIGYIVADIGVAHFFKEENLLNKCVYNPETLITNWQEVQTISELGFFGVFLAKEITIENICEISQKNPDFNLFFQGHGRFSMFHSKRHLLSIYNKKFNHTLELKNRADLFLKEKNRAENLNVLEDKFGTYLFRGKTTQMFSYIAKLKTCLKYFAIDPLFFSDEYAKDALSLYQKNNISDADITQFKEKYSDLQDSGFAETKTVYKKWVNF